MSNLIERQAALDAIRPLQTYKLFEGDDMILVDKAEVQTELMMLPPAQPEPKRGKWKTAYLDHVSMGIRPKVLYCSECNQCIAYPTNFCPNCGTDMRTAAQIVHDAIDNTPMAEDAFPGIKERLHKAVDEMREVTT